MERNEDMVVLDQTKELRSQYTNIHAFNEKFDELVMSVLVSAQKKRWMMYINFLKFGSKLLSTKSFKKLHIVELFVLMRKVIKRGNKVNELMRSFIEDKIKYVGVEAFHDLPVVKYYKPSTLYNMTLSDECLDKSHLEFINMSWDNSDAKATELIKILSQLSCSTLSGYTDPWGFLIPL